MKKMTLFNVLLVLVLCVVGLGFYRGWFVLSSQREEGNTVDVNLRVDPDKAKEDARAVEAKARDLTGQPAKETPPAATDDDVKSKNE